MKLSINGKTEEVDPAESLSRLLDHLQYDTRYVAVALNSRVIPRSQLSATTISEGDVIEIVSPQVGG